MITGVTMVLLAAGAPQLKLAVLDVNLVGFGSESRGFYTQHLATQLTEAGAQATTSQQIAAVLGLERQRQLLGCGEQSTECLAELANALGVDGIVMVDVAKVGALFQLTARAINSLDGQAVATFTRRLEREEALLDAITLAAQLLARDTAAALRRTLVLKQPANTGGVRKLAWIPAAAGAVVGGVGIAFLVQSNDAHRRLTAADAPALDAEQARRVRDEGWLFQSVGGVGLAVGTAALVAAGAMALFGGGDGAAPTVSVSPVGGGSGAAVFIGGPLP